jgi:Ca2+-binding EF-hand superfamily protein
VGELLLTLGVPLDKSAAGVDLVRAFFVDLDVNGDGRISLDEFLACVEARTTTNARAISPGWREIIGRMDVAGIDAGALFNKFDANSNGLLSRADLKALLAKAGAELSDTQFALFRDGMDLNSDGRIGRGEFIHAVEANRRELTSAKAPRQLNTSLLGKYSNQTQAPQPRVIAAASAVQPQSLSRVPRKYTSSTYAAAVPAMTATLGDDGEGADTSDATAAVAWRRVLTFLAANPQSAQAVEALFERADLDGSGTLTVNEVQQICLKVQPVQSLHASPITQLVLMLYDLFFLCSTPCADLRVLTSAF